MALLDGDDVARFFYHTDVAMVAFCASADGAEIPVGEIEAALAVVNAMATVADSVRQRIAELFRLLQQILGQAFSATAADAR